MAPDDGSSRDRYGELGTVASKQFNGRSRSTASSGLIRCRSKPDPERAPDRWLLPRPGSEQATSAGPNRFERGYVCSAVLLICHGKESAHVTRVAKLGSRQLDECERVHGVGFKGGVE